MIRSQKIKININNKQRTFIEKSFGVSRFTYNWILEQFNNRKDKEFDIYKLKKEFNHSKKEQFPFVYEVSKYASQEPFLDFKDALKKYYQSKGKIELHFKSKKNNEQSFYIGGDQIKIIKKGGNDKEYLKLPKMFPIKLTEKIRFNGHITGCRIIRKFNKYYVSIAIDLDLKEKLKPISNDIVGLDLGIKNHITLSNGLSLNYPSSVLKINKRIKVIQRKLSRKVHPRTKDDPKIFSKNYFKWKLKLDLLYEKERNIMIDYEKKVSKLLTSHYSIISIEDLDVKEMKKEKPIARELQSISFYRFRKDIEFKCEEYDSKLIVNDRYFPSSKLCSGCGFIKKDLLLSDRIYKCDKCGLIIDRDVNAAINLRNNVGRVTSEFTPLDLNVLIEVVKQSHIDIFRIEEGRQQKIYS